MKKHSSHIPENLQLNSVLLLVLLLALISGSAGLLLYAVLCPEARPEGLPLFPILFLLCAFDILVIFVYIFMVYLPVRRLTQALAQVMEGNFDDLLEETGAGDLSAASRNFNRFLISVRQMIHNEYNIKLLKKHAELNALQSQINPHFLYNTIDSIRGQALLDGSYDIAGIAKALASIFRYCIDTPSNMVTVREELQHVSNYFSIQQYRFRERFSLYIQIETCVPDIQSYYLPRLTLQPLVENSIGHGLEAKPGPGSVKIKLRTTQSRLIISIDDDGVGIPAPQLAQINKALLQGERKLPETSPEKQPGNRFALLNVNERIRITFGEIYGVRLYSTYGVGTQCEVILPIITELPRQSAKEKSSG